MIRAMPRLSTGQADVLFNGMLATLPHVQSGKQKLVAVSSEKRIASLPETPTVAEAGALPGFVTGSWQGMLAPARTPSDVVARIQGEVVRIISLPDIRERLSNTGAFPIGNAPQEFGDWLAREKERSATSEVAELNPLLSDEDVEALEGPLPLDPLAFVGETTFHTETYRPHAPFFSLGAALVVDAALRPAESGVRIAQQRESADALAARYQRFFLAAVEYGW